jgi:hypothetical protein
MVATGAVNEKVAASLAEKRRIVVSFDNRPVPLSPALDATLTAATLQNESAVRQISDSDREKQDWKG